MKKTMLLLLVALLVSGTAFAATLTPDSTKATAGAVIDVTAGAQNVASFFKFSKGVYVGANYNTTGYTLDTGHTSGTKYFGTGYDATAIYTLPSTDASGIVGATLPTPGDSNTTAAFAGWTKL